MDKLTLAAKFEKLDEVASDGVFMCTHDLDAPYDIRKAAKLADELGLKPGEQLPDWALNQCIFN